MPVLLGYVTCCKGPRDKDFLRKIAKTNLLYSLSYKKRKATGTPIFLFQYVIRIQIAWYRCQILSD